MAGRGSTVAGWILSLGKEVLDYATSEREAAQRDEIASLQQEAVERASSGQRALQDLRTRVRRVELDLVRAVSEHARTRTVLWQSNSDMLSTFLPGAVNALRDQVASALVAIERELAEAEGRLADDQARIKDELRSSDRWIVESVIPSVVSSLELQLKHALIRADQSLEHALRADDDLRRRERRFDEETRRWVQERAIPEGTAPVQREIIRVERESKAGLASAGSAAAAAHSLAATAMGGVTTITEALPRPGGPLANLLRDADDGLGELLSGLASSAFLLVAVPGFRDATSALLSRAGDLARTVPRIWKV